MTLFFFTTLSSSVIEYTLTAKTLTIKGTGNINQAGVRSKGDYTTLQIVNIEEGPSVIEENTFFQCYSLQSISIPSTVEVIEQCFSRCQSLSTIVVSGSNPNYYTDSQNILYKKNPLTLLRAPISTTLTFKDGVVAIENNAFGVMNQFTFGDVVLPKTVTTLSSNSFTEARFKSLRFEKDAIITVYKGFSHSFADELVIPKSVTSIPGSGFKSARIKKLIFEDGINLTTIEDRTFYQLSTENDVILPESITSIKSLAFGASNLQKIVIGSKCSSIHEDAFSGCPNLREISVSPDNTYYSSTEEGILMNSGKTEIIFLPQSITELRVPTTVQKISKSILQNSKLLTKITLDQPSNFNTENGVLYQGNFKFLIAVCGGVQSVKVHASATDIASFAASSCNKLETVNLEGVLLIKIGSNAFEGTSIKSFDLPSSVISVGVFAFCNCLSLGTFNIQEDSQLKTIGHTALYGCPIKKLFIPKNVETIQYNFANQCKMLENVTFHPDSQLGSIEISAFYSSGIKSIVFPKNLLSIGDEVFLGCSKLESVSYVEGCQLTKIGIGDFKNCCNLVKVALPPACITIDDSAFSDCVLLKIVEHSATTIKAAAFKNCISLDSFNFSAKQEKPIPSSFQGCCNLKRFNVAVGNPNILSAFGSVFNHDQNQLVLFPPGEEAAFISPEITSFSDNAFAWSTKLKHVAFNTGSSLESIGKATFLECTALQNFQFPSSLKTIGEECFKGCKSIKKITLPESITTINKNAFADCKSLKHIKFCGINAVEGTDVFGDGITISVTQYYNSSLFCNVRVKKELSVDCELIIEQITCALHRSIPLNYAMVILLLSIN